MSLRIFRKFSATSFLCMTSYLLSFNNVFADDTSRIKILDKMMYTINPSAQIFK
jgi:hypothetical protein